MLCVRFHPNIILYKMVDHSLVKGVLLHTICSLNYQRNWFLILTYLLNYDGVRVVTEARI